MSVKGAPGEYLSVNRTIEWQTLHWRHNGHDSVSNHQPDDCLLNRLFRRTSKIISKLRVTGLCVGNSPETGEFPARMASNAENVPIWWRHHERSNTGYRRHMFILKSIQAIRRSKLHSRRPNWVSNMNMKHVYTNVRGLVPGCYRIIHVELTIWRLDKTR